jgi:hypothetical protein
MSDRRFAAASQNGSDRRQPDHKRYRHDGVLPRVQGIGLHHWSVSYIINMSFRIRESLMYILLRTIGKCYLLVVFNAHNRPLRRFQICADGGRYFD